MAKVLFEDISYLNDPQCFSENYEYMSAYRRAALDNMKLQKDRMLSLGAGILLNKALDSCGLGGEYTIAYGKYGKPYFPQIKDQFRFSLSHSGTMAMCVFSSDVENRALSTGCDIQEKRKTDLKIAEHFFHPSEYELIMKEADHEKRTDLFYRLWTLKESCLKAAGTGTLLSMKDFRIELNTDENPSVWKGNQRMPFTFEEIRNIPGYCASYCIAEEHDPDGI